MAETNVSLQPSLFHSLDPVSLLLTSNSDTPFPLKLITSESFYTMERGPRYSEYAELREFKLRMKQLDQEESHGDHVLVKQTLPKKQVVKFQTTAKKGSSVMYQSVPDFGATLRKENRKPRQELTPPLPTSKNMSRVSGNNGGLSSFRGSKSANGGEKRSNGGILARKSYANVEELRGLSMAAATAINGGENRRGGGRKTILGYRQF